MLQDEAIRSAQIYLDYLLAHREEGLGLVRARVKSIQSSLLDKEMVLTTDRVMKSADGLVLRIGDMVYENTQEEEYFKVISLSRRKVVIEPSDDVADALESAMACDLKVFLESDLTFLVKRVKSWYEGYGNKVSLPVKLPGTEEHRLFPDNPIELSDNQYECAALSMGSPLTYIWGAPGTGKTKHVLASCVLSLIRAGKKVILVAPTNNALEQSLFGLLRALSKEGGIDPAGKVVRLGVPGDAFHTFWPEICEDGALHWMKAHLSEKISLLEYQNILIDESIAAKEGTGKEGARDSFPEKSVQELKSERKKNTVQINDCLGKSRQFSNCKDVMPFISEFSVVAATVDTSLYRLSPRGAFKPDHVFLDEAGYCNVIKGMTLLGFGKPLTLLGDHMQLPPVFEGEQDLLRDPEKRLARLWKISSLYLEDAVACGDLNAFCEKDPVEDPSFNRMQKGALTETFRFGPALAQVLAKRIYGQGFCSKSEGETKIFYINASKLAEDRERDEDGKHRRVSHSEAKCIRTLMESNLGHSDVTIGIIAPYRKQRRLLVETIERLLKKYKIEEDIEDDVVTVHQSQGREWDIVLFSVTDCYDEAHFTDSRNAVALKLINTAVSRAKKMLILVGDADDWKGKYGQLISELFAVGTEITTKERVVDMVREQKKKEEFVPWKENLGSLYMALSVDEEG